MLLYTQQDVRETYYYCSLHNACCRNILRGNIAGKRTSFPSKHNYLLFTWILQV